MRTWVLSIVLMLVMAFSLATTLEPWHQSWEGGRAQTENLIQVALGDSRQLFAKHFFLKADAYFHNGYYPTIYDRKPGAADAHIAGGARGKSGEAEDMEDFLGEPRDWIDRFSRNFFPSRHTHLGDADCDDRCRPGSGKPEDAKANDHADCDDPTHGHEHKHEHAPGHDDDGQEDPAKRPADEREILPWLKLSLELDPKRVQTYVVAAYWLRTTLKDTDQAERLLRDGLRQVPGSPEILFELGRILYEDRQDANRARNIWERALRTVAERDGGKAQADLFLPAQLLGNLATLEEKAGRPNVALGYLERLATISPNRDSILKWMETVKTQGQGAGEAAR